MTPTEGDFHAAVRDVQRRVGNFADEMRDLNIHVGINGTCVCGTPWPCDGSSREPVLPTEESNTIRCPVCESTNVECTEEPFHQHQCFDCGHMLVPGPTEQIADWLAGIGYGYDFTSDEPLPEFLRRPLAQAYYRKDAADGSVGDETPNDYFNVLAEECRWPVGVDS